MLLPRLLAAGSCSAIINFRQGGVNVAGGHGRRGGFTEHADAECGTVRPWGTRELVGLVLVLAARACTAVRRRTLQ